MFLGNTAQMSSTWVSMRAKGASQYVVNKAIFLKNHPGINICHHESFAIRSLVVVVLHKSRKWTVAAIFPVCKLANVESVLENSCTQPSHCSVSMTGETDASKWVASYSCVHLRKLVSPMCNYNSPAAKVIPPIALMRCDYSAQPLNFRWMTVS